MVEGITLCQMTNLFVVLAIPHSSAIAYPMRLYNRSLLVRPINRVVDEYSLHNKKIKTNIERTKPNHAFFDIHKSKIKIGKENSYKS